MKRIFSVLIVAIFAFNIACSKQDSSSTPTSPATSDSTTVSDGSTTDSGDTGTTTDPEAIPPSYGNDESEPTDNISDDNNQVAFPSQDFSALQSKKAKEWMHANLPGFGTHFKNWMSNNGYSDLANWAPEGIGGFGGFRTNTPPGGTKKIVILLHGNGSKAQGSAGDKRGWYDTYRALRIAGYNNSEIYAINFLPSTSIMEVPNTCNKPDIVNRVRRFIEAVYAYINQYRPNTKVNIIAHSLGCTVARSAMRDGNLYSKVAKFISIGGGNNGLMSCGTYTYIPTFSGFYYSNYTGIVADSFKKEYGFPLPVPYKIIFGVFTPATDMSQFSLNDNLVATNKFSLFNPTGFFNTDALVDRSYFMGQLNYDDKQFKSGPAAATTAYVILSQVDEINGIRGTIPHGVRWWTPRLAGARATAIYRLPPYGHFGIKSRTTGVQLRMLNGTIPDGDNEY